MEKRGLSEIVVTLIIILLTLIAVGIIWIVINNIIKSGAEQIDLGQNNINLEIKKVQVEGDKVTVFVKRNVGEGEFVGINFIFSDGLNSEVIRRDAALQELEERSFSFTLTTLSIGNLKTVSIAPIFKLSSGVESSGIGTESVGNTADSFDTSKIVEGIGTGSAIATGNFAKYGAPGFGTTEYTISGGENLTLKITRVVISPLDVHLGDNQTFIAYVSSPYNITEVITRTQLDNEVLILPLEKTENPGEYMATWTVYDTHTTTYRTNFTAKDSMGNEDTVTMSWTDPCTSLSNHGTTTTISSPCSVGASGVDGVYVGNIIISTGGSITVNSGGNFIYTPGYSISFSGTGKILQGGGSLRKAYIYYNDADGDLYGSGYDWKTTTTSSGDTRADLALGESDCNDTNSTINPGQTAYFTSPISGTSSYDVNCDGLNNKLYGGENGQCETCSAPTACASEANGVSNAFNAVIACGTSGTFITSAGSCEAGAQTCNTACTSESRTQACR